VKGTNGAKLFSLRAGGDSNEGRQQGTTTEFLAKRAGAVGVFSVMGVEEEVRV